MSKRVTAVLFLSLSLGGCFSPTPPAPEAPIPLPAIQPSEFLTNVSLPISSIRDKINPYLQNAPGSTHWLDEKVSLPASYTADVTLDLTDVNISGNGNSISAQVKFNGHVHAFRKHFPTFDFYPTGDVTGTTAISLNANWTATSQTAVNLNLSAAHLCFKVLGKDVCWLSLKDFLSDKLRPRMNGLASQLDGYVASVSFKSYATKPWMALQQPIGITKQPPTWLKINPAAVYAGPFINDPSRVAINVGMSASPELMLADQPPPSTATPLPDLAIGKSLSDEFHLRLRAGASLSELSALLDSNLAWKEIDVGHGAYIVLNSLAVSSTGKRLVLRVDFGIHMGILAILSGYAPVSGTMYLVSAVQYDRNSGRVVLSDLDFDVGTKNLALNGAAYLLHDNIVRALQSAADKAAVLDVKREIDAKRQNLQAKIGQVDLSPAVQLTTQLDPDLGIDGVYVTPDSIVVDAIANGHDQVIVH